MRDGRYVKTDRGAIQISNSLDPVYGRKGTLTSMGLSTVGTIIHESGHLLSNEHSSGEYISKFFEEGMVDVFAEECVNHFLQNASDEELQYFKIDRGRLGRYVSGDGYVKEADFVGTSLDVIRQTSGRAKEVEYEYFFGNKEKVVEICKDTLGDKYVEILRAQKKDMLVGDDASLEYNNELRKIIKGFGKTFKYEKETQDGEINVYASRATTIRTLEKARNAQDIAGRFYEEAIKIGNYEGLIKLKQETSMCTPDLIKRLAESDTYSNVDLIKYISTFEDVEPDKYAYLLDKDKILSEDFNNVDANARKILLSMLMKSEPTDERNIDIIKKIEESALLQVAQDGTKLTDEEKLLTIRCKYLSSSEHKGERLTAMMDILQNKNINIDDFALDFGQLVEQDFKEYLKNYAKEDIKGKEKLIGFFDGFEGKQNDGQYVDPVSMYYKNIYYKQIYEDLSQIKTVMSLDGEFEQEVYDGGHYSGEGKYIPRQGATLRALAFVQKDTVLIDVFDKQNVKAIMDISSIAESFTTLSDEQKDMVLDIIEDMKSDPEYMSDLRKVEDYTRSMLEEETNQDIVQRKQSILSSIDDKLKEREKPLDDISRLLSRDVGELSATTKHICKELIDKLYTDIETERVQDVSMEKLADIARALETKEGAEYMQATTVKSLTSVMSKKQLTTQGLLEEISSYSPLIRHETLIQSYLESIGKGEDKVQKDLLMQLDELAKKGIAVTNPQYITYQDQDEQEKHIILLNGDESIDAYSSSEAQLKSNEELLEVQNKGKKGIFSIFKSKKQKEMISRTVVISQAEENKESQILNIYENGRIEIATMTNDGKHRITSKEDVETSEIGRNAALVPQKEKSQIEVFLADKIIGDNEYRYEENNKTAPSKDERDDLDI